MLQRLGMAQALLGAPRFVFLDEPASGVDPAGVLAFRELLSELKRRGTTVILNSHQLDQLERVCDRVAYIEAGRIRNIENLRQPEQGRRVMVVRWIVGDAPHEQPLAAAAARSGAEVIEAVAGQARLAVSDDAQAAAALRAMVEGGLGVIEATPESGRLEKFFRTDAEGDLVRAGSALWAMVRVTWRELLSRPLVGAIVLIFCAVEISLISATHDLNDPTVLLTVLLGAGSIGRDVSSGVLPLLFTRPVARRTYVFAKWIAVSSAAALVGALVLTIQAVLLWRQGAGLPAPAIGSGALRQRDHRLGRRFGAGVPLGRRVGCCRHRPLVRAHLVGILFAKRLVPARFYEEWQALIQPSLAWDALSGAQLFAWFRLGVVPVDGHPFPLSGGDGRQSKGALLCQPASGRSTRARPTVLLVLAAGLLLARVALGVYEARHPAGAGGLVNWRRAEGAEIASAIEKKPILYDFSAGWCEPCRQMEHEVFADAEAAAFINKTYLPVRVPDEDQSATLVALRARYEVGSLPTLLIVHPGAPRPFRTDGYAGKRRTMSFLRGAASPRKQEQPLSF